MEKEGQSPSCQALQKAAGIQMTKWAEEVRDKAVIGASYHPIPQRLRSPCQPTLSRQG